MAPKPGKIKIYTSGWPKNQNKCWNNIGSPSPAGSKKEVLILRSVNNMVIAPARTGSESKRRITVNNTAHTKNEIRSNWIPLDRVLIIVVIKLILLRLMMLQQGVMIK